MDEINKFTPDLFSGGKNTITSAASIQGKERLVKQGTNISINIGSLDNGTVDIDGKSVFRLN
jgi:hypothetical protein